MRKQSLIEAYKNMNLRSEQKVKRGRPSRLRQSKNNEGEYNLENLNSAYMDLTSAYELLRKENISTRLDGNPYSAPVQLHAKIRDIANAIGEILDNNGYN